MGLLSPQISLSANGGIWPESAARDPLQLVDTQHVFEVGEVAAIPRGNGSKQHANR